MVSGGTHRPASKQGGVLPRFSKAAPYMCLKCVRPVTRNDELHFLFECPVYFGIREKYESVPSSFSIHTVLCLVGSTWQAFWLDSCE